MRAFYTSFLPFVISSLSLVSGGVLPPNLELSEEEYDFIVVGGKHSISPNVHAIVKSLLPGGTAGNVIANRLSEDQDKRVLVIEAGQLYVLSTQLFIHSTLSWRYTTAIRTLSIRTLSSRGDVHTFLQIRRLIGTLQQRHKRV
jgi:hypothetical protein